MKIKKNKRDAVEYSDELDLTPSAENLKSCEVFYKLNLVPQHAEELDTTPLAIPVGYEVPKTKREILNSFGYSGINQNLYEDEEDEEDINSFDYLRDEFYEWASQYEIGSDGYSEIERIIAADEANREEMQRAMEYYKARQEELNNPPPPEADERVVKADGLSEAGLAQPPRKVDSNES